MRKREGVEGSVFYRLTVIKDPGHGPVLCACSCGNTVMVRVSDLKRGNNKSCGCLKREKATIQALKNSMDKFVGEKINSAGYRMIYKPEHPKANCVGYVLEHRLVMEQKIGRMLLPDEDVHHINQVRTDNRPENLQLMTRSEHRALHMRERNEERRQKNA